MNRRAFLSKLGLGCLVAPAIAKAVLADEADSIPNGLKEEWGSVGEPRLFVHHEFHNCYMNSFYDDPKDFGVSAEKFLDYTTKHFAENNPWNDLFPK